MDATVDQDVDAAWQQEVARRLDDVQSGKVETVSWEEVQQKGRTLLHGKYAASISSASGTRVSDITSLVSRAQPDSSN